MLGGIRTRWSAVPTHGARCYGTLAPEIGGFVPKTTYKPVAKVRWLARPTESAVGSPQNDRNLASRGRNSAFSGRIDVQSER